MRSVIGQSILLLAYACFLVFILLLIPDTANAPKGAADGLIAARWGSLIVGLVLTLFAAFVMPKRRMQEQNVCPRCGAQLH